MENKQDVLFGFAMGVVFSLLIIFVFNHIEKESSKTNCELQQDSIRCLQIKALQNEIWYYDRLKKMTEKQPKKNNL